VSGNGKRLYVGNFPYTTTEQQVRDLFAPFGGAGEVRIITDRETGRSKGFGFVDLLDGQKVQAAIAGMNGKDFEGRDLRVAVATDRPGR
jgi:RNA recognition motif-containing protein